MFFFFFCIFAYMQNMHQLLEALTCAGNLLTILSNIFWPLVKIFHPSSQGPGPGPGGTGPGPGPGPAKKDGKCVFFQTGFRAVIGPPGRLR